MSLYQVRERRSSGLGSSSSSSDDHIRSHHQFGSRVHFDPSLQESDRENSTPHLTPNRSSNAFRKMSGVNGENGGELPETPSQHRFNEHFAKKLPPGAEASNILVGEVDFLSNPIIAFVRLAKAIMLGDLTEVQIPTRFLFVLLGPSGHQQQYHEIGRSIATLMSDEVFHDVAYKAHDRSDLLSGIDEFLEQVTVLPPGEWDPTIRIEPPQKLPSQAQRKTGGTTNGSAPNGSVKVVDVPEEEHGDSTLERTGRLFGGLIADVKRKVPFYPSDITDAIHVQSLASFFFVYFACLTPIITFGGLLGAATNNNMAAMESILSGAICGISYHLFAGQPLTIIGSTGPVLVFETIVYNFCAESGLNYLSFRFWIGMWVGLALFFVVAFDLSALVRYITRFTEESFATLIALIFIVEAFKKLFHIMDDKAPVDVHPEVPKDYSCYCVFTNNTLNTTSTRLVGFKGKPVNDDTVWLGTPSDYFNTSVLPAVNSTMAELTEKLCKAQGGQLYGVGCGVLPAVPNVFFFSCILFLFTFTISYSLKYVKNMQFFPTKVRSIISDFAVVIAIVSMVLADFFIGLKTPKLEVPDVFRPTRLDRGWVVNPVANPLWTIPASILPALLATILIFMDQQITAVIVNRKENKLKKGGGYHLDLFIITIQIMICSLLGIPWFVAATVLSINHVRSLSRESETAAPGERPQFLGVREQRVTGVTVFIFVGCSVFLTMVLRHIAMPILYGVFLFMGVSSLNGVQLIERIGIVFMPSKYQPDYVYLRNVPLRRVHLFTAIQVLCLGILWAIKTIKVISIVFPLMVLAMCFVRKGLEWVFTHHELKWLDDIMPESHKREKEEKKKQLEEEQKRHQNEAEEKEDEAAYLLPPAYPTQSLSHETPVPPSTPASDGTFEMTGGAVSIPLKDGKSIAIPVDKITYNPLKNQVSISDEMSKKAIWKQLVANESNPDFQEGKGTDNQDQSTEPHPPEIIIDPPNLKNTTTSNV